ncbi:MAG: hypothetical protein II325_03060 [Clostridia bacterium]|nr:hypothetical protein [Clostridia bacterium]
MKAKLYFGIFLMVVILIGGVAFVTLYADDNPAFDIDDPATWLVPQSGEGISDVDSKKLLIGMTFEEAISLLGRPQRNIGSGVYVFEWDMEDGNILRASFAPSQEEYPPLHRGDLVCLKVGVVESNDIT